jgi:hypothetical protein
VLLMMGIGRYAGVKAAADEADETGETPREG